MIKILLTVTVFGLVSSLAGVAMAQDKQAEAPGSNGFSSRARLEAQCAHRLRTMPPDPRDECVNKLRKLRSDAQIGYGQGGDGAFGVGLGNAGGQGNGIGAGGGQGNGIGPGSGGGGRGNGRR